MKSFYLTVEQILQRPLFKNAQLIAGVNGLQKQVHWSHIVESPDARSLINGYELILTTGFALGNDEKRKINFIEQLVQSSVSAICIELGPSFPEVPSTIQQLADQYDVPLIIFPRIVKFVDITQDLHAQILNQHHEQFAQLDQLSRSFYALSLQPNGLLKILNELHEQLGEYAYFISTTEDSFFYPVTQEHTAKQLEQAVQSDLSYDSTIVEITHHHYAQVPVQGMGQTWGFLFLAIPTPQVDDFVFLVLDRAALAITQILLRNRTIEERKQNLEDDFVRNLCTSGQVHFSDYAQFFPQTPNEQCFCVLVLRQHKDFSYSQQEWEELRIQRSIYIRSICRQKQFDAAVSSQRNELIVIVRTKKSNTIEPLKALQKEFKQFLQTALFHSEDSIKIGISGIYTSLQETKQFYTQSLITLHLQQEELITTSHYHELGILQLFLHVPRSILKSYVEQALNPLLRHDKETKSQLIQTLQTYLACNGSKKETAKQLFIVRQTLYHRLEKIEQLIGPLDLASKRLTLETALLAKRYLATTPFNQ